MDHAHAEGVAGMKCSLQGCPGEYEERRVFHAVRSKGRVVVIDHVPAEVCSVCGDVLFTPQTVRGIEKILQEEADPAGTVPVYEYA